MRCHYNEISAHTCQNGYHQQINKQQVLVRMWRKENLCALFVGMQNGAATVENSMEHPQKIKNETALCTINFISGYTFKVT